MHNEINVPSKSVEIQSSKVLPEPVGTSYGGATNHTWVVIRGIGKEIEREKSCYMYVERSM